MATDRRVEIVGEGGVGHQGHRLAREHSHAAPRRAGKVLSENNVLGGAALYQSRAPGPRKWKMSDGSWRSLSRGQGFRHGRVSPTRSSRFESSPSDICIQNKIVIVKMFSLVSSSRSIFFFFFLLFLFYSKRDRKFNIFFSTF